MEFIRQWPQCLGLILVVQILLWFLSGLAMAILPIEQVRGEHLRTSPATAWQDAQVSPATLLAKHSAAASFSLSQQLSLNDSQLSAMPVYVIDDANQRFRYSAGTGQILTALAESDIRDLAQAQYSGSGQLSHSQLLSELPQEVKNLTPPLWQVQFTDSDNTTFYIDPATGAIARVRTSGWRLFDFFWMLHIMDYQERSNFNNPLLISTAAASLLFTLTGLVMLWQRYRPRLRLGA